MFGAIRWSSSAQNGVATPTGTVMLAALPVLLGIQLLLQAVSLDIQNQPTHCLHRDALLNQDSEPVVFGPLRLAVAERSEKPSPRQRVA